MKFRVSLAACLLSAAAVAGSVPANAVSASPCNRGEGWSETTVAAVLLRYPNATYDQVAKYDRNDDTVLCTKDIGNADLSKVPPKSLGQATQVQDNK